MSVVFKYKHPCSYEYAPGYVNIGVNGEQGKQGSHGNAMYFTDYELNNSYDIELALQKIENNYVLSNNTIIQLQGREYKVNDIILSNSGNCYKLIESSSKSLFKNYKFDISFLGKIHKSSFNHSSRLVAYDFTNSKIYDSSGNLLREFPSHTYSPVPTNRVDDDFDSSFYSLSHNSVANMDKYFSLYGTWIKFVAFGDTTDTLYYDQDQERLKGVKYSLEIQLKNRKTLQGGSAPVDASGAMLNSNNDPIGVSDTTVFEAGIPIEFSNICTCDYGIRSNSYGETDSSVDANTQTILSELVAADIDKPLHLPSYISDYTMDMLHPSGNNIKCTLNFDKSMWYKSGKGHWPDGFESHLGYNSYVRLEDEESGKYNDTFPKKDDPDFNYETASTVKGVVCEDTLAYYKNMHTVEIGDKDHDEQIVSVSSFKDYAAGLGISALSTNEMQGLLNNGTAYADDCNFIVASNNSKEHAGESMYFSAKPAGSVANAIMSYLFSMDNKFILTSKDHQTRECITTEVSIGINNEFKDADIYVKVENGNVTRIKVIKHQ